jgi:hypothetical protein
VITTPRRDKIPVRVVKEEEPLQHRLIRRISRVPGHTPRVAHPSAIWSARAINTRHIPPASLALGLAPDFRPLVLTGQARARSKLKSERARIPVTIIDECEAPH